MQTIKSLTCASIAALLLNSQVWAQDDLAGNPLEDVVHEMKVAADHLAKKATDKPTQKSQDDAVSKLDTLIAELEKQRQQMGQGANPNPTRPAMDSSVREGPGGMGDLHGARMQGDRWGELPAHERDRILQSLTEGFPPHYQAVLEAYYKKLAVEKRADDSDSAPASKATTAPKSTTVAPTASDAKAAAKPASTKNVQPAAKSSATSAKKPTK